MVAVPTLLLEGTVQLLREGYSERLFLLTDERGMMVVRKQAKPEVSGCLLAEIAWLEELPPSLHRYFPRVLRSNKEDDSGQTIFYDMPYLGQGWVLLSELILTGALDREVALALIEQVMWVMFSGIYPTTYPEEEPGYCDRLILLLERCAQRIPQLPAFSHLVPLEAVAVNGVKLWNILPLLNLIKGDERVRAKLRPAAVRKVHGDLHPENILVYIPSLYPHPNLPPSRGKELLFSPPLTGESQRGGEVPPQGRGDFFSEVVLLDPIAPLGLSRGDFAMDIAKFTSWLSAELLALRLGLFAVHEARGSVPAFELTLHTGNAQLSALNDRFLLHEFARLIDTVEWARAVCDADPQWWQRVSFYEALYALSMVPLVPFPQSLARFLVGLGHLQEFVCDERSGRRGEAFASQ